MDPKDLDKVTNEYKITVNMHSLKRYCGDSGPFFLTINGEDSYGQEFLLRKGKFNPSETYILTTRAFTVGKLTSVVLRKDKADRTKFACKSIDITQGPETMSFPCDDVLTKKRDTMELFAIEAQTYIFNMTPEEDRSLISDQPIFV